MTRKTGTLHEYLYTLIIIISRWIFLRMRNV